jgi:PAP2 superfamily
MALCNLIAFIVFTAWPCMPPRLLSDANVKGPSGAEARSYGFVDTVHGDGGKGSVWTQNKFCNQYAAMPSLHFGYSLLIGLTVATIPIQRKRNTGGKRLSVRGVKCTLYLPSIERVIWVVIGVLYPFTILVAIIATANHFILDAVAGAVVCGLAWYGNRVMLNLLPLQDWFFWCIRTHVPETCEVDQKRANGGWAEDDESDLERESVAVK